MRNAQAAIETWNACVSPAPVFNLTAKLSNSEHVMDPMLLRNQLASMREEMNASKARQETLRAEAEAIMNHHATEDFIQRTLRKDFAETAKRLAEIEGGHNDR